MRIEVHPRRALVDQLLDLRLAGLAPGQTVTVRARLQDDGGQAWAAAATFVADDQGQVDTAAQAPLHGGYQSADAMGLIWSLEPDGVPRETLPLFPFHEIGPLVLALTAEVDGKAVARVELDRQRVGPDVVRQPVREAGLVATFFRPAGRGPFPAVVVLGGSGGGLDEGRAALLASHGYATLALAYFRIGDLPEALVDIPLEYFERAIGWLQSQQAVDGERLGIVGASRGGEAALLLGATFPALRAVVGYVPSGVVWGGISAAGRSGQAAWTYRGEPVPYLTPGGSAPPPAAAQQAGDGAPKSLTPVFLAALEDEAAVERATIPVEKINGPVLLISGKDDALWPSAVLADHAYARLQAYGHPHPFEHLSYAGAGHLIGTPYFPTTTTRARHSVTGELIAFGGTAAGYAAANVDSWAGVLRFLKQSLAAE